VGGPVEGADDPGELEVYGYASWQPRLGILAIRNPADRAQSIQLTLRATPDGTITLSLQPFQVLLLERTTAPTPAAPSTQGG
jgi:hypothetical protein